MTPWLSWIARDGGRHERGIVDLLASERVLHVSLAIGPRLKSGDALPVEPATGTELRPAGFPRHFRGLAGPFGYDRHVALCLSLVVPVEPAHVGPHESHAGVALAHEQPFAKRENAPLKAWQ